jgi:hypothetical protein
MFSAQYLDNVQIDYVNSVMGSGFTFNNPNSQGGCGCGSSSLGLKRRTGTIAGPCLGIMGLKQPAGRPAADYKSTEIEGFLRLKSVGSPFRF